MNRVVSIGISLVMLFSFAFNKEAFSWTEGTHGNLSEYAAESSVLDKNKGDYLKNLGFDNGIEEELKWGEDEKKIRKWIAEGTDLEDEKDLLFPLIGTTRSFNHFHNPLRSWLQAGLDDFWTGQSSLLWAQDGANQMNFPEEDWSWQKIREYYYLAFTSITDTERQANFARTFRGLGHQVHLIQDAAQPDHVRNDAHPEDTLGLTKYGIGFEKWAGRKFFELNKLRDFVPNPENYFPTLSLDPSQYTLDSSYYTKNLVPSALLFDTDQYNGSNPSTSLAQGIAEYTNANFFSDHTIFAEEFPTNDGHYFPYPKKSSTNLQYYIDQGLLPKTVVAEDGIEDITFYISKDNVNDGETIDYFVKPIYFADDTTGWSDREFYRDERCHENYASLLIPRAVGYSAGLLDYFFRGEIQEMEVVEQVANQAVTGLTLTLVNLTLDEEMKDGDVWMAYQYKAQGETDYTYGLSDPLLSGNVPYQVEVTYTFNFPSPIPAGATDVQYTFVFKGTLGQEVNAVVGKVLNTIIGDFIFLVVSDTEYAVWQIVEDGGFTLVPVELRLEDYTQSVFLSTLQGPSVVKPNKNYNYHRYMIQTDDDPNYGHYYHSYGSYYDDNGTYKAVGLRNSFQPPNWDINEDWVFDSTFVNRYSSSRHPFIVYNQEVIKNLSIWEETSTLNIYYDSIAGVKQGGIAIPDGKKYAVLTPDLYIGHGPEYYTFPPPQEWDNIPKTCGCACNDWGDVCTFDCEGGTLLTRLDTSPSRGYPFYFGSVLLGNYGDGGRQERWSYVSHFAPCYSQYYYPLWYYPENAPPPDHEIHIHSGSGDGFEGNFYTKNYYLSQSSPSGKELHIMDYDVLVPNVTAGNIGADDTFIIICYEKAINLIRDETTASPQWVETYRYTVDYTVPAGSFSVLHISGMWQSWSAYIEEDFGNSKHYQLKYRLNGGEVVTIPISDYGNSYRKKTTTVTGYTLVGEGGLAVWDPTYSYTDTGDLSGGIQVENPTSLATEKFLFYSYTLKEGWPAPLTFLKRILGVINVETGARNEYEVDDAFLGNLYSGTFDETKASAIGLHKKLVQ